jgi:hypothetical protein
MFKRIITVVATLAILSSPALAGDRPEFDCVGDDSKNFFNDIIKEMVILENGWNLNSDFTNVMYEGEMMEYFIAPVQLTDDICFMSLAPPNTDADIPYQSALTQWRRPAVYNYQIVLQMDPQSDLDINIVDCVVKHNSQVVFGVNPWEGADQTGRYQMPNGDSFFLDQANPQITVVAHPGPHAVFGFDNEFTLNARRQPGLVDTVALIDAYYTSKALWEEDLVVVMPMYNAPEYPLSAGDMINIEIKIPSTSPVDIRYGEDNVCIKYVGITGTIYTM